MSKTYSVYDAKAKLSELLRAVKSGTEVVITERGKPIAKVSPLTEEGSFATRIEELRLRGLVQSAREVGAPPLGKEEKKGALDRFLKERE